MLNTVMGVCVSMCACVYVCVCLVQVLLEERAEVLLEEAEDLMASLPKH